MFWNKTRTEPVSFAELLEREDRERARAKREDSQPSGRRDGKDETGGTDGLAAKAARAVCRCFC